MRNEKSSNLISTKLRTALQYLHKLSMKFLLMKSYLRERLSVQLSAVWHKRESTKRHWNLIIFSTLISDVHKIKLAVSEYLLRHDKSVLIIVIAHQNQSWFVLKACWRSFGGKYDAKMFIKIATIHQIFYFATFNDNINELFCYFKIAFCKETKKKKRKIKHEPDEWSAHFAWVKEMAGGRYSRWKYHKHDLNYFC